MLGIPLRWPSIVAAIMIGAVLGLGIFTFIYAEGFSYFSNDPKACVNCHIMNDEYASWVKSPHHAVATCNDCHVPHQLVPKLISKGRNGYNHSRAFTLQNFHEPIMITAHNATILQENCLSCHGEFVWNMLPGLSTDPDAVRCVHCHRGVGHGPVK